MSRDAAAGWALRSDSGGYHHRRSLTRASLLLAVLLWSPAVAVRAQESAFSFNIPATDAASALTEFSMQSGLQVLFDYEAVQGVHTAPIAGRHGTYEALRQLPTWVPMLRFPYLKEGDTRDKRDGMREWLRDHGYRAAPVSIDSSDGYYNQRYLALQAAGRSEPVKRLRRAYVRHLLDRAAYYDNLARAVIGRSPAHVMRLHTNALNAAALPEVIEAFRNKGWHFVATRTAFEDALYTMQPMTLPAGENIIWALAKERGVDGLRDPPEDAAYERPLLQRQGLAP